MQMIYLNLTLFPNNPSKKRRGGAGMVWLDPLESSQVLSQLPFFLEGGSGEFERSASTEGFIYHRYL